jgi:hypothetical protein
VNRLSPLVARTPRSFGRARVGAIGATAAARPVTGGDLRLFVTTWLGGVVFFTTLLA